MRGAREEAAQAGKILFFIGLLVLIVAIYRTFAANSRDFVVFWKTARYVLAGEPAYSVKRDGAWVFKYPPWLLPLFLPFGLMSLQMAKSVWGILQILTFVYVVRWTLKTTQFAMGSCLAVFLFWGLWLVNAQDGQVSLLLLAVWLWAGEFAVLEKWSPKNVVLLGVSFAKVFTGFPLLGLRITWKSIRSAMLTLVLVLVPLSLPALWVTPNRSVLGLSRSYVAAMLSGGKLLSYDGVRGKYNQSLDGLLLRLLHVPAERTSADILCFLILGAIIAYSWYRLSKEMHFQWRWAGWIGLTPVVHPLPFWYSFVWAFPLASVALSEAWSSRRRGVSLLAWLGVAMITIVTEKTLGAFGAWLELLSIKSWGVLLCCAVLVLIRRNASSELSVSSGNVEKLADPAS